MFMVLLHTKFHMPSSNGSLVIVVKLKAKENVRTAAMLLFYSLQKIYLYKNCMFRNYLLAKPSSVPYIKWFFVTLTSQVRASGTLLLYKNLEVCVWGGLQWHNVHTKFYQNPFSGSRDKTCGQTDGQTRSALYAFISYTSCKERIIIN
jgi:hypothetical protein